MMDDQASIESEDYKFLLYYHYVEITDPAVLCEEQLALCDRLQLNGRIRISSEGINGTLGGSKASILEYIRVVDETSILHPSTAKPIHWKVSSLVSTYPAEKQKLQDLSVKVTKEVVSLDLPPSVREAVAATNCGEHLSPAEFHNALQQLAADESLKDSFRLLDIRNHYEVKIGTFEVEGSDGSKVVALNPETRAFSDTAAYLSKNIDEFKDRKIFMYCTGGVRCERASSYLRYLGVDEVYQLHGGIHNYQCEFPDGGFFRGKNFVFDPRIAIPSSEASEGRELGIDVDDLASEMHQSATANIERDDTIIGRCLLCCCRFDDYSSKVRCAYCRMLVLVCDSCRQSRLPLAVTEPRRESVLDESIADQSSTFVKLCCDICAKHRATST